MRICSVVGARPQFIKASVVSRGIAGAGLTEDLVHTGQHYDDAMSRLFFEELEMPEPDVNLEAGSGSHAVQTGSIMVGLEQYLGERDPYEVLLVYGDTNSTIAAALVGSKLGVPVAHVEAGLRSFNRFMPEEINRIVTDRLSNLLFCPSETAVSNLSAEGILSGVSNTGDVMYDALLTYLPKAQARYPLDTIVSFAPRGYYLATVHRAENTDNRERLMSVLQILSGLDLPVVLPLHPRTRARLDAFRIAVPENVMDMQPVGYLRMLVLASSARAVLTDSGGLQKEAYWHGVPCVTLRTETEWTETVEAGWNVVADLDPSIVSAALSRTPERSRGFPFGRGDAAGRIATALKTWIGDRRK